MRKEVLQKALGILDAQAAVVKMCNDDKEQQAYYYGMRAMLEQVIGDNANTYFGHSFCYLPQQLQCFEALRYDNGRRHSMSRKKSATVYSQHVADYPMLHPTKQMQDFVNNRAAALVELDEEIERDAYK